MLRVLVVVLYVCAIPGALSLSDEMQELVDMLHNTCVGETGVDEALIVKVQKEKVFEDDEKLKCYIRCLLVQMALISDDGIIDPEGTIALLPEEQQDIAAPIVRACGTKIGANPCENAWLTHKCYAEGNPDIYMLP
ncbi:general odorant-binding protein 83a-like [Aethina tumida]|uniref:general odorant-binding protein 83a-like n=1 Tax=Aethina tumida TaxID=116153 RepID=UPI00214946D9|nr:general odorant-binding protein 83a-like [Aethina tumida]